MMTAWIDTPASTCDHEPNARGTACQHCGLTAEMVTPDELAEAMMAELDAARLRAGGQTSWLDTPEPSRCWHYLHTSGVAPIRCSVRPDHHDGAHEYAR